MKSFLKEPKLSKATIEDWAKYYKAQAAEADKQLAYVCAQLPHILRLSAAGKHKDVGMLSRRMLNRLQYPRDKNPIIEELGKHEVYKGSVLRDEP